MHSRAQFPLQVLLLTAALCLGVARTGHALADLTFNGTVTGTFSSPVLNGNVIDVNGNPSPFNNGPGGTNTAACSLVPCPVLSQPLGPGSNTFTWGSPSIPPIAPTFSSFRFTGVDTSLVCGGIVSLCDPLGPLQGGGVKSNTIFPLGTFEYTNGTSALDSLVFGVHFHLGFTANGVNPTDNDLVITTTDNGGPDAKDSVSFKVQFCTTIQPFACSDVHMLLGVGEGAKATATLLGLIHADPDLLLTGVTCPPNDPNCVVVTVPEPGSLILLGLGLVGIALTRRFRPVKR
jgi:hypothetical protein